MKFKKVAIMMAAMSALAAITPMTAVPAMAAVTYRNGNVTINKQADQKNDVTYEGFLIFNANVADAEGRDADKSGKTETNIAWANTNVQKAVEEAIKEADSSYSGKTAQDAAEFIITTFASENTSDSSTNVANGGGTRVDKNTLAHKIAKAVNGLTVTESGITPGTKKTVSEGYWLFVTTKSMTDDKQDTTGTAPVFAVIGGSDVTITEKTSIPSVDKTVTNDATDADKTKAADSQIGQDISYELTGTLPDNFATFDSYKYTFTDTLPDSMTADADSVHVYADNDGTKTELLKINAAGSNGYTVSYGADNKLIISFTDLKSVVNTSAQAVIVNKDTKIIVDYNARIDATKAENITYGASGNQNSVQLTYSNNPYSNGTGTSTPATSTDYVYRLKLHKVDRTTEVNLPGAQFTVQVKSGDDAGSNGKYVQEDGSLGDTAYAFTTDDKGELTVPGLDAGTYTVTETKAPTAATGTYDITPAFDFTIGAEFEGETLTSLTNTLTATDSVIAGSTDGDVTDNVIKAGTSNDAANKDTGEVLVTVGDVKRVSVPLTGQRGIAFMLLAGGTVLGLSLYSYEKKKKKDAGNA